MSDAYLAVVNPAAGGGRCRRMVGPALERLRAGGIQLEAVETKAPGEAIQLTRDAYARGFRRFIAVGGDGTSYEIVNGLFPAPLNGERPTLAFLPLGTGNSFLRDFSNRGVDYAMEALLAGRTRPCDVLRLTHQDGVMYFINLLSMGFAADVAATRHRRFSGWGEFGYLLSIFICLARLRRRPFPLRVDAEKATDQRRCLFLSFNNSKFTGGTMMIAPNAEANDGLIEYVRWGPVSRLGLIRNLPTLYSGEHIHHPMAERKAAKVIDFFLEGAIDVMVDGEVMKVECKRLEVLPSALSVMV